MITEEKQLLLIDLCARLPYGIIVRNYATGEDDVLTYSLLEDFEIVGLEYIKPYLRSMSSMTEEEIEIINNLIYNKENIWTSPIPVWVINESDIEKYVDFCNSHHLDYRGLIEKDLALEAPEDMY